jgi:hypothetical protein
MQHKFIEKCNTGASKMLAKIKEAKEIRDTLAQNQPPDPDDVQLFYLLCACTLVWSLWFSDFGILQEIYDATVRINEDYGETVPLNSQPNHETHNDGWAGNDNRASLHHDHVPQLLHPFHTKFRFVVILALLPHHVVFLEFLRWFCSPTRVTNDK